VSILFFLFFVSLSKELDQSARPTSLLEGDDMDLSAKAYIYHNIIPALAPALEIAVRDRPPDPLEFIAFYMLRHSSQYQKTVKIVPQNITATPTATATQ